MEEEEEEEEDALTSSLLLTTKPTGGDREKKKVKVSPAHVSLHYGRTKPHLRSGARSSP